MIPHFSLYQPDSVEAAARLLSDLGNRACVLAGGSDLVPRMKTGRAAPTHIVDIKAIARLKTLEFDDRSRMLTIGSLVTHRALESSVIIRDRFPLLARLEQSVGNVRVRTVGTLGGNLCGAEPHSDPATLLLAYGARVRVANSHGERLIALGDFLVGAGRTTLDQNELLVEVELPELPPNVSGAYLRYCPGERPMVSVACLVNWNGHTATTCTLVVGCVEARPLRLTAVEQRLANRSADDLLALEHEAGRQAAALCAPTDDIFASSQYKRHLVGDMVAKAIRQVCAERIDG